MTPFRPLKDYELDALRAYAKKYGHTWKERLRQDWYHARANGILHSLRNTHGPKWLNEFSFPEVL